ncbi:SDR family oxidoreductase [Desulfotalea psychrophila]|uniref:Probable serine dehydrogenase n=1 Tax=Desulfotalea psychrophila (strain LSv54 / DSM 12343) TaxID=177439 RepID=Q6AQI7_DESPS|nr:SDR family oxidoreductase [Desulfotalea psychrophila]CAG35386.1 probable serine dehydrogenase [Desulfotalea psychrophila LSv54]
MQKTILITGATSGFGKATAKLFAAHNWQLILCGRRQDRLETIQKELENVPVHIAQFDISVRDEVEDFVSNIPQQFSQIDILVNNAGLALGLEGSDKADLDHWQTMINTNISGLLYMTRLILPQMMKNRTGHIINIGSVAGSYPYPGGNTYGASKAFVAQFSRNLRCDVAGTGIRVTNIEPGLAETEFSAVRFSGDEKRASSVYAGHENLSATDIAETIFWSASRPAHVNINSIEIMPVCQSWAALAIDK